MSYVPVYEPCKLALHLVHMHRSAPSQDLCPAGKVLMIMTSDFQGRNGWGSALKGQATYCNSLFFCCKIFFIFTWHEMKIIQLPFVYRKYNLLISCNLCSEITEVVVEITSATTSWILAWSHQQFSYTCGKELRKLFRWQYNVSTVVLRLNMYMIVDQ